MTAELSNVIFLLVFEVFIFFSSVRLLYFTTKKFQSKIIDAELVLSWVSIGIILNVIIVTIFSFSLNNGLVQYVLTSFIIFILLHINKKTELVIYKDYLVKTFNLVFKKLLDWKILLIFSLLIPFIALAIRPVTGFDSLLLMNSMLEYTFNQIDPYTRTMMGVPTWDLAYLPSIIISNSDSFFWVNSLKPLIIIGLGTYLIGKELKLPKYLIWISIFSSLLFFKIWLADNTFIGSIKNDYILASGFIIIVYSTIRSFRPDFDRLTYILFLFGIIFITIKLSGILFATIAFVVFIFINRKRVFKKKILLWGILALIIFSGTTGHYYLYSTVEYGNPVYPVKLNFMGLELPGNRAPFSTSIFESIEEEELWEVLYPTTRISKGGVFFPVFFTFGVVGTLGIIGFIGYRFLKTRKIESKILIISSFVLITWIIYFASPFSASNYNNPLFFIVINELVSLRFVIGTLFVTELFFIYVLWRLKVPSAFIFAFVGISIISRYWILNDLYRGDFDFAFLVHLYRGNFEFALIMIPIILLVGLFLLGKYSKKFIPNLIVLSILGISVFFFAPHIVEVNREYWNPIWDDVSMYLHDLPPSEIFLIDDNRPTEIYNRTYLVIGNNFRHSVEQGTDSSLIQLLSQGETKEAKFPDYVVKLCTAHYPILDCEQELSEFKSTLEKFDYDSVVEIDRGILLKNVK